MRHIPKASELHYDSFDNVNPYLCMNYIRDSLFELMDRGYDIRALSELIEFFEDRYNWEYDPNLDNYELLNVCTRKMSEVDEMHELATALKCLNTLDIDGYINYHQWKAVKDLYQSAYNDCIKALEVVENERII